MRVTFWDNLKLGFGGTQQEMYRLLQTAQELEPTFDAVFSMDAKGHLDAELADIIEAIHIIQTDMEIVGTTAAEASGTISGSFASAKAAFENFMSGLANPDADVGELFDRMVESAQGAKDNLIPAVQEVFANVGELAAELGPELMEKGKEAVSNLIEGFRSGDIQSAVSEKLDGIAQKAQEVFGTLYDSLPEGLQGLVDKAGEAFGAIGEYLGAVWQHIEPIVNAIREELPGAIETAKELFQTWLSGLIDGLTIVFDTIKEVFSGAADLLKGDFDSALDHIENAWGNLGDFFRNIADTIKSIFDGLVPWFTDVGSRMWEGLKSGLSKAFDGVKELGGKIVDRFKDAFDINSPSRVMRDEVGIMLARGMADGIAAGQRYVDAAVSQMIPTTSVDFAHSAIGKSSAASINASMLGQAQTGGGNMTVNLVVDGKTLASVVLDPLKQTLRQKGEALA